MSDQPTTLLSCTMSQVRVTELNYGFGSSEVSKAMIDLGEGHHLHEIVAIGPDPKNPRHIVISWERV